MKCLIINPPLANNSHGTGKQIQYLIQYSCLDYYHLCWDSAGRVGGEPPHSNLYYDVIKSWPFRRGRGALYRLQDSTLLKWYHDQQISLLTKLRLNFIKRKNFDVAYVIVSSDANAAASLACLNELNIPYVLNWMDLESNEEISSKKNSNIVELIKGAASSFAITSELKRTLQKHSPTEIEILYFGRPPTGKISQVRANKTQIVNLVMIGSTAYSSISTIWPLVFDRLREAGVRFKLHYIGPKKMFGLLPSSLNPEHLGFIADDADRDARLAEMHFALLPGPDGEANTRYLARYSIPSRLGDFLIHGLPVVGSVDPLSATKEELNPIIDKAVFLSLDPEELAKSLIRLIDSDVDWIKANATGIKFARDRFDAAAVAKRIEAALRRTAERC